MLKTVVQMVCCPNILSMSPDVSYNYSCCTCSCYKYANSVAQWKKCIRCKEFIFCCKIPCTI